MTDEANVQQAMVTGKCEVCGEEIKPGKTQGLFNMNKGHHMYAVHGIKGKYAADREKKKKRHLELEAMRRSGLAVPAPQSMHSKGTPEERRAWAVNAVRKRWQNRTTVTTPTITGDLGRDMTMAEVKALTPEQKKERTRLRKNKWWNDRYKAELNGTKPVSSVTGTRNMHTDRKVFSGVPAEFQNLFTKEELRLMRPMSMFEGAQLRRDNPAAYKKRGSLKSRLHYHMHKDRVRASQKAYVQRLKESKALIKRPATEVATQPVSEVLQEAFGVPKTPQATPCKLNECPVCHSRFYVVKGPSESQG